MTHLAKLLVVTSLAWSLASVTPAAAPAFRLNVNPRVGINEGVRIEAVIPRHADNRRMRIEMDGPLYRAFEEPMEGESARVIYSLFVDRLPEGDYTVYCIVLRADGTRKQIKTTFCRGEACYSAPLGGDEP